VERPGHPLFPPSNLQFGQETSTSPSILRTRDKLHAALKPAGVLFSSNPHGRKEEGWSHGRYGVYHDLEAWRRYMLDAAY
jgi:hypothetical protein